MKTEKRIFASPFGMDEQTGEQRLQWAEENGMVWSVEWFISSINCDMINTDIYQLDTYEAELNNSMVSVNIVELASELAHEQTKIEMFNNHSLTDEENARLYVSATDGITTYTDEAQDIFNRLYDYYYNVILKCQ
jgi:hypothetical protein